MRKMSNHLTSAYVSDGYMSKSPGFGGDPYFCIDIILHFQSLNLPESLGRWSWKGSSVDSCWFPGIRETTLREPRRRWNFSHLKGTGPPVFFSTAASHRTPRMLMDPHDEDARRLSKKAGNFHQHELVLWCSFVGVFKTPSCFFCFLLFCCLFLLYKMKYRYVYLGVS